MKPFLQIVGTGLDEVFVDLRRTLDGLDEHELHWRPTLESNSIDWIVWRMSRSEDFWITTRLSQTEAVWVSQGWRERIGVYIEGTGYAQTLEQIRAIPKLDVALVMWYYEAVRERTKQYFTDSIEEEHLGKVVGEMDGKTMTVAPLLGHLLAEVAEHLELVDYIRGMKRGINK